MAKAKEKQERLSIRVIYQLPSLPREQAAKENQTLNSRQFLLDEVVPHEKLKVRSLELFNGGLKVNIEANSNPRKSTS